MDAEFKDELWRKQHDAHQIHHRIADFILHHDDRDQPPKLKALIKKYRFMMAEAAALAST